MKILFISQNFPYPPYLDGARLKTYNLIKHLSKANEIFLITFCDVEEKKYIDNIAPYCTHITTVAINFNLDTWGKFRKFIHDVVTPKRFDSPLMSSEITKALQRWRPDIIHVDLPMMSQYFNIIDGQPKVISSVDAISLVAYKNFKTAKSLLYKSIWYWLYRQRRWIEEHIFPHYDVCAVVSDEDKAFLKGHCPNLSIEIIPNGVDVKLFSHNDIKIDNDVPNKLAIGLFGVMSVSYNIDAVLYFISEIYPIIKTDVPNVKLYIVGRNPPESTIAAPFLLGLLSQSLREGLST